MQINDNLITAGTLCERLGGISAMSLWRWVRDPALDFPKPIMIRRRRYWREAEIAAWEQARVATSTKAA